MVFLDVDDPDGHGAEHPLVGVGAEEIDMGDIGFKGADGLDAVDGEENAAVVEEFPDGVDVVFSNVLGELHPQSYRTLRPKGTLVTIGEVPIPELAAEKDVREIDLVVRPSGVQLAEIASYFDSETIKPPAVAVWPMAQGASAMLENSSGHTRGKIVLQFE